MGPDVFMARSCPGRGRFDATVVGHLRSVAASADPAATGGHASGALQLPRGPASARLARQHVQLVTGRDEDPRVALVVTELVANAVLHARTTPWLWVGAVPDALRIEVYDDGPGTPAMTPFADAPTTSGRGLAIVDRVAASWGVRLCDAVGSDVGGKTVWAVVHDAP